MTQFHTEQYKGFLISLAMDEEQTHPDDHFDWEGMANEGETAEQCRAEYLDKIDRGIITWCIMSVAAFRNGIMLAVDYLGGVSIDDPKDFIDDPYYTDMRNNVVKEALKTIKALSEEAA